MGNTGGRCFGTNNGGHISMCLKQHLASDNFLKRLPCALGTAASVKRLARVCGIGLNRCWIAVCVLSFSLQSPVQAEATASSATMAPFSRRLRIFSARIAAKQIFHKYKYCGCFSFSLQSPVRRSPSHTVAHYLQGSAWRQRDRVWAHLRRASKNCKTAAAAARP